VADAPAAGAPPETPQPPHRGPVPPARPVPARRPRTLGLRLALWYAGLFAASSLATVLLTYFLLASSLRQRDHEIIESTLDKYATDYQGGGLVRLRAAIAADRVAGRHEQLFVRVIASDAEAVFFTMPRDWQQFDLDRLVAPPPSGERKWTTLDAPDGTVLEVASVRLPDGTLFQVGKSSDSRQAILERFRAAILLILVSVLIIGLTGGAILTERALQPVHQLADAVRAIVRTGRVDARVPVAERGDALDELSGLFNGMLDRIDALIGGMRGALDNVAHDLRTPMMRLRGIAERALLEGRDAAAYREALADALEESDRVVAMLDTLMDISEAETGTMRLASEPVDVARLLADTVDLYSDLAEDKGLAIEVRAPEGLHARADRNRLRQVVANLVDNAVKYTAAGGRVDLDAARKGGEVVVTVRDTGAGIAAEDLPRIWDRLYRGDKSRSERGLGLGLSLVRAVVQAHGGRVEVFSEPGRGSTFTLHLPAADADA
jgi:heavy metal sensor kinase